jgi:hypothetical protein
MRSFCLLDDAHDLLLDDAKTQLMNIARALYFVCGGKEKSQSMIVMPNSPSYFLFVRPLFEKCNKSKLGRFIPLGGSKRLGHG